MYKFINNLEKSTETTIFVKKNQQNPPCTMNKDIKNLTSCYIVSQKSEELRLENHLNFTNSIIQRKSVNMEEVGKGLDLNIQQQSGVMKFKRFLKNKFTTFGSLYLPFVMILIKKLYSDTNTLFLAIDGTNLGNSCGALMVSAIFGEYQIPLCWSVKKGNKGHFSASEHQKLLETAKQIIPNIEKVIVLGDGEFYSHELVSFIEQEKWQYVFRMAKDTIIEDKNLDTYKLKELEFDKFLHFFYLENCTVGEKRKEGVNIFGIHEKQYKDPIYLASNIDNLPEIRYIYKKRWWIETLFAGIKSRGFNIHKTRIKNPEMLSNLLIFVCIAFCFCHIIGKNILDTQYILPNILRKDRIDSYSAVNIGLKIVEYCYEKKIPFFHFFQNIIDYPNLKTQTIMM